MSVQPSLIHEGWIEVKDGDESARTIFDRHYSRHRYADGRKPKQFIGPGVKKPLVMADGLSVFAFRKCITDDGQTGVNIAIFRREGGDLASNQIKAAVALAREKWWPFARFYTYIDPRKVRPTMFRGYPVFGWCFYKAGFHFVGVGKGGKHVLALELLPPTPGGEPHVSTDKFTAECSTCHQVKTVCCGSEANGFWCHDCCQHPYADDDDGYPYDDEDNEDEEFDCHRGPDGSCGLAGTEECDWECPYNR